MRRRSQRQTIASKPPSLQASKPPKLSYYASNNWSQDQRELVNGYVGRGVMSGNLTRELNDLTTRGEDYVQWKGIIASESVPGYNRGTDGNPLYYGDTLFIFENAENRIPKMLILSEDLQSDLTQEHKVACANLGIPMIQIKDLQQSDLDENNCHKHTALYEPVTEGATAAPSTNGQFCDAVLAGFKKA